MDLACAIAVEKAQEFIATVAQMPTMPCVSLAVAGRVLQQGLFRQVDTILNETGVCPKEAEMPGWHVDQWGGALRKVCLS